MKNSFVIYFPLSMYTGKHSRKSIDTFHQCNLTGCELTPETKLYNDTQPSKSLGESIMLNKM